MVILIIGFVLSHRFTVADEVLYRNNKENILVQLYISLLFASLEWIAAEF